MPTMGLLPAFQKPSEAPEGLPKVRKSHKSNIYSKQSESILYSHFKSICGSLQTNYGQKSFVLVTILIISGFQLFSSISLESYSQVLPYSRSYLSETTMPKHKHASFGTSRSQSFSITLNHQLPSTFELIYQV